MESKWTPFHQWRIDGQDLNRCPDAVPRLLVETHNKYMRHFQADAGDVVRDDEQEECMEGFISDFNRTSDYYRIEPNGRGHFIIVEKHSDE